MPGVYFLEIDGLAHDVIRRALRDGHLPTLARWVRDGTHRLLPWETDWSSQTGACQAGLLHGSNDDMPAFRWWEKEHGRAIVTNHPKDAAEIERRHSDGRGLLHADGASRANILSGDAPHTLLTMSTVLQRGRPGRLGEDYYAYFSNPYSVTRTVTLVIGDIVQELYYAAQQRRRDIRPRIKRSFSYALVRAWGTVIQRDLQVAAVIGDLYAGRPVGYTTFLAYDEVAHHSGRRASRRAGRAAPPRPPARAHRGGRRRTRPGPTTWSSSPTTGSPRARPSSTATGRPSRSSSPRRARPSTSRPRTPTRDESLSYLGASLTEASGAEGDDRPRASGRVSRKNTEDGEVVLGEDGTRERERQAEDELQPPELSVMASGCLGLISFPREPGRVSLERIDELYPALHARPPQPPRDRLRAGALRAGRAARARRRAASTASRTGRSRARIHWRRSGPTRRTICAARTASSTAPTSSSTAPTGPRPTRWRRSRSSWAPTVAWAASSPIPFALAPAEWAMPAEPIVGAEEMHQLMRRWLADLGHEAYKNLGARIEPTRKAVEA